MFLSFRFLALVRLIIAIVRFIFDMHIANAHLGRLGASSTEVKFALGVISTIASKVISVAPARLQDAGVPRFKHADGL
jgi:hypothetical protein